MSLNQILKWLLEQVAPMLIQWLMQLIDLYFPANDRRRFEFKRRLLGVLGDMAEESKSQRLHALYSKQSIRVNKDQYKEISKGE